MTWQQKIDRYSGIERQMSLCVFCDKHAETVFNFLSVVMPTKNSDKSLFLVNISLYIYIQFKILLASQNTKFLHYSFEKRQMLLSQLAL